MDIPSPTPEPVALDLKIQSLNPVIAEPIRREFVLSLKTVRLAENPAGALGGLTRLLLIMLSELFCYSAVSRPSDNLFSCLEQVDSRTKDRKPDMPTVPAEIISDLHNVRVWSNKIDHAAEQVTATQETVEQALGQCFRFLEWLYCICPNQPNRLESVVSAERLEALREQIKQSARPIFQAQDFSEALKRSPDFVGRQWLFDEIDHRLTQPNDGRCLFITGPPGVGKSMALAAWINSDSPHQVIAHHFFRYDRPDTTDSQKFIASIVAKIIESKLDGFAEAIEQIDIRSIPTDASTGELFRRLVADPLNQSRPEPGSIHVIAIDAADEAKGFESKQKTRNSVTGESRTVDVISLCNEASCLPPWAQLLFTSRVEGALVSQMPQALRIPLGTGRTGQHNDIYLYALQALERMGSRVLRQDQTMEDVARILEQKSDGIFLYVECVLKDSQALRNLDHLPNKLPQYFDKYFRERIGEEVFEKQLLEPLQVLLAVGEPVTDAFIAKVLKTKVGKVKDAFTHLGSFTEPDDAGRRNLMHKSLADWLGGSGIESHSWTVEVEDGKETINQWLKETLRDLNEENKQTFLRCSIFHGPWNQKSTQIILQEGQDLNSALDTLDALIGLALVEKCGDPFGATVEDEKWFYINPYLRQSGLKLLGTNQSEHLKQRLNAFTAEQLTAAQQKGLNYQLSGSHKDLDVIVSDRDQMTTVAQGNDAMPLFCELLVRGQMEDLAGLLVRPSELWHSVENFDAQRTIVQGILAYVRGDYKKTAELAARALRNSEDTKQPWLSSAARCSLMLSRSFLGEEVDIEGEMEIALSDAQRQMDNDPGSGRYWLGMAHMQAGTLHWHRMRTQCETLGGEHSNPHHAKAEEHYRQALAHFKENDEKVFRVYASNSLGHILRLRDERATSLQIYFDALPISIETKNVRGQLGFAHGIAGWLGWAGEKERFISLMSIVESLYLTQNNTMIPPIRAEYDLFWQQNGGKPYITKPGWFLNTKSALLQKAVGLAQIEYEYLISGG